ncbi:MAG TPA: hypothetical protein DC057_02450, partial [Spirochaetia bacterium]|nr:hypothetical protein [Spirochaetia bacterium]
TVTFDGDAATTASNPTSKTVTSPATKVDELPDAPAKTGFYFGGWFTAKNGAGTEFTATTVVTASITVYAKWTAVPVFTVSFNTDSGSAVASQSIAENSKATRPATNPTKSGYTFDNWYADSGKTTVYDFNTAVTSAKTIYAKWTANMYTVTFDGDGATTEAVSATKTVVSPATTVVTLPTAPVKTGYTFAGWYTDKNGAGTEFTATTVVTGDVKVYAKWNSYSYTVTFDGDYATKTVATPATTVVTLPTAPAKTGYTFAGWYTEENGEGTEFTAASVVTGDVKVYAKLTINQYTVTYNSNNATGGTVPDVQTQNYNSSITVRSNSGILVYLPENAESRKFGGWNTKADGTGVNYLVGSGGFTLTEDIILYVKWGVFNLRDTGPAGGLIFYDKGVYSDGWRYLESWTEDEAGCYFNSNVIIDLTVVTSTANGTGYANTYNAMEGAEYVAAEVVRNATHGGKNDWFMPSLDELNQMCWVLHSKGWPNVNNPAYGTNQVGGFRDTFYWSSSIEDKATVWYISFSDGDQRYTDCRGLYLPVRAVRAF